MATAGFEEQSFKDLGVNSSAVNEIVVDSSTSTPEPPGSMWVEKESAFNEDSQPKYPHNNATQTKSGHTFELDDTPGRERIRIQHKIESFVEMHPDGSVVHKIVGDGIEVVVKNKNISIKGNYNLTVQGDARIDIQGSATQYVKGDYDLVVDGDYTQTVKGDVRFMSDSNIELAANPALDGSVFINTGGSLTLETDLIVNGELVADKITSTTRVDAGTGISAGPLGFVSVLGGLSIGAPIATPFTIFSSAVITTPGLVAGSLGTFNIMSAHLMTDTVNCNIFNMHRHIVMHRGPRMSKSPIPIMKGGTMFSGGPL